MTVTTFFIAWYVSGIIGVWVGFYLLDKDVYHDYKYWMFCLTPRQITTGIFCGLFGPVIWILSTIAIIEMITEWLDECDWWTTPICGKRKDVSTRFDN